MKVTGLRRKRLAMLLLAAGLFAPACLRAQKAERAPAGPVADLAAIERLEQKDVAASKVNDVDALTSLWTDDGVLLQPGSLPVVGKQQIHALLLQQRQQNAAVQVLSYDESWKERRLAGDSAFEWGIITATLRLPNGKEVTQTVYAGRYLVRAPDHSWHIARAVITPGPRS